MSSDVEAPARGITFITDGGVRLSATAWGDSQAPPVLLLHGGGQTRHSWADTGRMLGQEGCYAVALDLRGHGDSDWPENGDYEIDAFAADVLEVARSFALPPVAVGASLGGIAGLLAHAESELQPFSGLVLVDIAPRMELAGVQRIVSFMLAHLDGFSTPEEAADAIARYLPNRPRPKDLAGLTKNLRQRDGGRYYWHWDPRFLVGKRPPAASGDHERLLAAARRTTVPTLLLRGKRSDVLSEDGVKEFLRAAPHARFVDVSDAGHMVVGDRNDIFAAAILTFVRDLLRARPGVSFDR